MELKADADLKLSYVQLLGEFESSIRLLAVTVPIALISLRTTHVTLADQATFWMAVNSFEEYRDILNATRDELVVTGGLHDLADELADLRSQMAQDE